MTAITVDEPLLEVGCLLGEGPIYDKRIGVLHFVDILEKKVYHLKIATNELSVDAYPDSITCLALHPSNPSILACAAHNGFGLLEGSSLKYLVEPIPVEDRPYTRFNDGGCDRAGRFYAGTVYCQDPAHPVPGMLYRFDPSNGTCVVVDHGPFTDSNGLGWSPDETKFYFTDSVNNLIYQYDYSASDGDITNREVLVDANKLGLKGTCDGLCIDTEGGIWGARWQGSSIVRYFPDGTIDFTIAFPKVWRVTACCFAGPDNDQLYVTSAHCGANGSDPARQAEYPQSGHLFKLDFSGKFKGIERHFFQPR